MAAIGSNGVWQNYYTHNTRETHNRYELIVLREKRELSKRAQAHSRYVCYGKSNEVDTVINVLAHSGG